MTNPLETTGSIKVKLGNDGRINLVLLNFPVNSAVISIDQKAWSEITAEADKLLHMQVESSGVGIAALAVDASRKVS